MNIVRKAQVSGRFQLTVSGGKRGLIEHPWMDNMVTDYGLNIFRQSTRIEYIGVGSSNQLPSPSDTGLVSPIGRSQLIPIPTNAQHGWNDEEGFGWTRYVGTFARGAAAGNVAELAALRSNNNTTAMCRALVVDGSGNPSSITVLSDEVLTVTWELRRWWVDTAPHTVTYMDDGEPKTTTVTYVPAASIGKDRYGLGTFGDNWQGSTLYATGVYRRAVNYSESQGNPSVSTANASGAYGGQMWPYTGGAVTFDPPISKTSEFTLSIVFELTVERRTAVD